MTKFVALSLSCCLAYAEVPDPISGREAPRSGAWHSSAEQLIANLESIRVFISVAPGFGHQAATVNVMRRLRALGYLGDFEVVYDNNVRTKLGVLLPTFRPEGADSQRIDFLGGMTVMSEEHYMEKSPRKKLLLGITGADDLTITSANQLDVELFIKLQPSKWQYQSEILSGDDVTRLEELETLSVVLGHTGDSETALAEMEQVESLKHKITGIRMLLQSDPSATEWMPVYGVGVQGVDRLKLAFEALRQIYTEGATQSTVLVPVLSSLDAQERQYVESRFQGKDFTFIDITDVSSLNPDRLKNTKGIIVIYVGSVTQNIFSEFFSRATLPGLVAGRSSTDLATQLGKPFINTVGDIPYEHTIPSDSKVRAHMADVQQAMLRAYLDRPEDIESLKSYFKAALDPTSEISAFHRRIGEQARELSQDKVARSLELAAELLESKGLLITITAAQCRGLFR